MKEKDETLPKNPGRGNKEEPKMSIHETIKQALDFYSSGNLLEAERLFQEIVEEQPDNAEALHLLGIINAQLGNYDSAIKRLNSSLQFNPADAGAHLALGMILRQKGLNDEAIGHLRKSISLNPGNAEAYSTLGSALEEKGSIDDAISAYRKAMEVGPGSAGIYTSLGNILQREGKGDEAIACFHEAVQIDPNFLQAYYGLAVALVGKWRLDEAIHVCNKILQLNKDDVRAYFILGNIMMTQGRLNEAERCFRRAIQIKPDELKPYQAFLMLTSYHPQYDPQAIFSAHLQFAGQFESRLHSKNSRHINDRTVDRRLRIGYVSPDFRGHAVAYFIEPVLLSHNRDLFEIFCYSDVSEPDEVTNRIKGYADQWRDIAGMPDEKVAGLIRKEEIDILIDLAGHTGAVNRILLFAHKPAPVQASWIGYPSTTGLSAMDYKIVDGYTDPPGMTEQFYTERILRLPDTFLCYLPDKDSPDVSPLPALTSGHITFGSFNNFVKVVPEVISLWAKILRIVPKSRLIMKSLSFLDATTRNYAKNMFFNEDIGKERVDFLKPVPSIRDHLSLYNQIDIGLDTFPYNGTTTTCEALWMGVPVVTLAGDTHASRVGTSLLSNIGLKDLVAKTREDYIGIAVDLARNTVKLRSLRERLRDMMAQSSLTNSKQFTLELENCYRKIWEAWCTERHL